MHLITYRTACKTLGWSYQKLIRWATKGKIPAYKADGTWIFLADEVEDFILKNKNLFSQATIDNLLAKKGIIETGEEHIEILTPISERNLEVCLTILTQV